MSGTGHCTTACQQAGLLHDEPKRTTPAETEFFVNLPFFFFSSLAIFPHSGFRLYFAIRILFCLVSGYGIFCLAGIAFGVSRGESKLLIGSVSLFSPPSSSPSSSRPSMVACFRSPRISCSSAGFVFRFFVFPLPRNDNGEC
ncbi:uncharacterized protein EI97DRAFT_34015 [Westerdykella ornata]|uniref:Transmembrane protein n=1 Tax=Westerdykella ornata TaxID=318751 RepID=A0A6A6JZT2_WESOR|nr:uncharacterized protein EI97DRAFT_34015 [Westerdykella ornata]KAF2281593.1 hypothetical protein EI97DRAFT_34015 [Westerdykella ornata]